MPIRSELEQEIWTIVQQQTLEILNQPIIVDRDSDIIKTKEIKYSLYTCDLSVVKEK